MGIFTVTATYTDDDYKRPRASSITKLFTSREDAVAKAVDYYLDRLDGGCMFDWHEHTGFSEIVEKHKNDEKTLISELYDYFQKDPEGFFVGDYVPETLNVTISEKKSSNFDTKHIMPMIDEITRYIKEELGKD